MSDAEKWIPVLVELKIKVILDRPADSADQDSVNFYLNDSSHCLDTEFIEIAETIKRRTKPHGSGYCSTCNAAEGEFIRVATDEDIETYDLRKFKSWEEVEEIPR